MFTKKPLKRFHVSAEKVYLPGKKTILRRAILFFRPYTKKTAYRISGGYLLAL